MTGDTDFTQTAHLDRLNEAGDVTFVFGMDCSPTLHVLADEIPADAFRELQRRPKYQVQTTPRTKPERVKEQVVIDKGYRNIRLQAEHVAGKYGKIRGPSPTLTRPGSAVYGSGQV
ncbi:MAG: hypothetical protein ISQ06_12730 [Planctomycetaceae bacterium]|nr:hypothetical protein [Planctomycetaceae bacterium]